MSYLWEYWQDRGIDLVRRQSSQASTDLDRMEQQIRGLEATIDRLKLVQVAFAELLCEKVGMTEDELIAKVRAVDMRDGVQDGKIASNIPLCPNCSRRYDSKKNRCLYCGYTDGSNQTLFDKVT